MNNGPGLERSGEKATQPPTKYIKHAGTIDDNLLFWNAGTFYIQALCSIWLEKMLQMNTWTPITLDEIYDKILETAKELNGELLNFWDLIKINPEK